MVFLFVCLFFILLYCIILFCRLGLFHALTSILALCLTYAITTWLNHRQEVRELEEDFAGARKTIATLRRKTDDSENK